MSSWKDKSEKQVPRDIASWLLANCWPTVGQLSTDSFHYVSGQGFGLLSATSWLTEGDLLATCCDPLVTKSCADQKSSWKGKSEEQFPKDIVGRLLADC